MSEIRVDSITDEAGTGSPDFINGLTVQGRPVETGNTTVRQTVLSGPVDSDGRADFLSASTGLQVVSITSAPLNITFGDGFNDGKQRNFGVSIDSNLTWGDLPDDEDAVFLVLEIDGETVTPIHTTLEPHYGLTRPDTPSEGQLFYPTDHRHQMERYDGSEWKRDKNWIVVGECATSGGSVVETRSYAYQGIYYGSEFTGSNNTVTSFTHNIGVSPDLIESKAVIKGNTTDAGIFEDFVLTENYTSHSFENQGCGVWLSPDRYTGLFCQALDHRYPTADGSVGGTGNQDWNAFSITPFVQRAF